jgi:probable HAF family extracellular repeat protein
MRRTILAGFTAALLIFVLPTTNRVSAEAPLYTVQDLGTLNGLVPSVTGVNASGEVSGYVSDPNTGTHAARFRDGKWSYLPGLETTTSLAFGINDHGDVVGYMLHESGFFRAFRYVDGTGVELIDPLPGGNSSFGMAINNNGVVVGSGDTPDGPRAWRASRGLPAVALPTFPGGTFAMASGVNDASQVVGTASTADGFQHAFRAEVDDTLTDLGAFPDGTTSLAVGIDGAGRVSGRANRGDGNFRAFRYSGSLVDLDSFGALQSSAEGMSNGTTVGWYTMLPTFENRAFAHTVADGSFDLNDRIPADSGWVLQQAKAVNSAGQIIGTGLLNNQPGVFLLSLAVPPDTTAPTINNLSVTPASIVPPNKTMIPVTVSVSAIDDRDMAPACWVTHIDGHGAPAANFSVTGSLSGSVRAVGGSTYSFFVTCADAAGNAAQAFANVVVPPDTTGPVFTNLSATPAMIWPPQNQMVPVAISAAAMDDSGDVPACRLGSITSSAGVPATDFAVTGVNTGTVRAVGGRTYTLNAVCTDSSGNSSWASTPVFVKPDTTAPAIKSLSVTPYSIWPANGKMVAISVSVTATDDVDSSPACSISSINSSDLAPGDAVITGTLTGQVRAEKGSDHSTRIYTVHVTCMDSAGNTSEKCVDVRVARDEDALNTTNSGHKRDKYTLAKRELKELKELLKLLKRK